jgi:hypothetical protein
MGAAIAIPPLLTVHVICSSTGSADAVVHGLLALGAFLALGMALGSGIPAAATFSSRMNASERADSINRGLGIGFLMGIGPGVLLFVLFAAKVVS